MDKKIQRAFDAVQAGDGLKDSTADFLHQKLYARPQRTARRRAVPAVCCALLLLLAFTGYGVYSMPVAAISVEAAETVELQVNAFDRVVAYACLSPGGQAEIDALGLTHKTYGDAVAALVENGGEEAGGRGRGRARRAQVRGLPRVEGAGPHGHAGRCPQPFDARDPQPYRRPLGTERCEKHSLARARQHRYAERKGQPKR